MRDRTSADGVAGSSETLKWLAQLRCSNSGVPTWPPATPATVPLLPRPARTSGRRHIDRAPFIAPHAHLHQPSISSTPQFFHPFIACDFAHGGKRCCCPVLMPIFPSLCPDAGGPPVLSPPAPTFSLRTTGLLYRARPCCPSPLPAPPLLYPPRPAFNLFLYLAFFSHLAHCGMHRLLWSLPHHSQTGRGWSGLAVL